MSLRDAIRGEARFKLQPLHYVPSTKHTDESSVPDHRHLAHVAAYELIERLGCVFIGSHDFADRRVVPRFARKLAYVFKRHKTRNLIASHHGKAALVAFHDEVVDE